MFATQYSDDININRTKRIFKKYWALIKNNTLLNHIFPSPPVIAYKANSSLRKKLVRARLKPLDQTNLNPMPDPNTQEESQLTIEPEYPFNLFKHTSQNHRNPVKRYNKKCNNRTKMETKSFAYSTIKAPIMPPPLNQNYNHMSRT